MAEYIEREALLKRIDGIWDCADMVFEPNDHCCRADDCASCKWRETKNAIRKIAANIPADDVRPVVRGKWEDVEVTYVADKTTLPFERISSMRCNQCNRYHTEIYYYGNPTEMAHFCPNCGADMREES